MDLSVESFFENKYTPHNTVIKCPVVFSPKKKVIPKTETITDKNSKESENSEQNENYTVKKRFGKLIGVKNEQTHNLIRIN